MAQKQFKIGLSNTDKQNMAQDVYERVLALTFNEYDTTTQYEVGDFVVYNDQLYKCISATSGAWDSTKWQLATLNDLVNDIENAVAFVNDKANVNGNYPTMTVGFADNLTPYDESAGDDQDEPFILQATGTGNGTQPDFSTGSGALMKEKQGNTVVVNQLNNNDGTTGDNAGITYTKNNDGSWTLSGTASALSYRTIHTNISFVNGHKYLLFTTKSNENVGFYAYNSQQDVYPLAPTYGNSFVFTSSYTLNANLVFIVKNATDLTTALTTKVYLVDLTQWFNNNIPQDLLDHPDHFFRYYNGSLAYNEGTLVNANGRYLKTIGRNQWDEEWELGEIDPSTGEDIETNNWGRTKNFIKVIPNATYYFKTNTQQLYCIFYDENKNLIKSAYFNTSGTFDIPNNCCYIRFTNYDWTTYNHDITVSIYYEGESGYDQYYPYEELANIDTGTEVLRSAGIVKDSKAPDGTITRRVGVVDLSQYQNDLVYDDRYACWVLSNGDIRGKYAGEYEIPNIVASDGTQATYYYGNKTNAMTIRDNGLILIGNGSSTTKPTCTIYYELATSATEQGTSFSENVAIDDFGSMDFGGTNNVPQGASIFYAVDYKAFVDSLYKYTDGAPSKIALKSDLVVVDNKIGAKLPECPITTDGTYVLKATVSSGTVVYSWVLEE